MDDDHPYHRSPVLTNDGAEAQIIAACGQACLGRLLSQNSAAVHVSTIQILGFKSFADRVELPLEPGVTGIVGPGGCGKRALLEAVRWALGESSPAALRVETMRDLIFHGTFERRPLRQATVSLVFAGCPPDWALPGDELRVTRQINKTGEESHHGQNGDLEASAVSALLAGAEMRPPALVREISELPRRAEPILLADLRGGEPGHPAGVLEKIRRRAQVLMVTHEKSHMQLCDCMWGVTMEELGMSKMVGMQLTNK